MRAMSQRRLTKDDREKFQKIYEEANNQFNEGLRTDENGKKHELFKEKLY